jgi:hypothetical protein
MKIVGTATDLWPEPMYLKGYDVNSHGGIGSADLTPDPDRALTWPDVATVLAVWKMQSTARPTRLDGQPNRPLTAYTIEPEQVPEKK